MPKPKLKPAEPITGAELIGRNVRLMMECRNTDAPDLAKYLAISEATFYRRLKKPQDWTLDNLSRMAQYWEITLSELAGEIRLVAAETDLVLDSACLDRVIRNRAKKYRNGGNNNGT